MSRILIVLIIILFSPKIFCQGRKLDFSEFEKKFQICSFPIFPDSVFLDLEGELQTSYISKKEFDYYLRTPVDTIWKFSSNFQYRFGGKFELDSNLICLFYGRYYMPEDINKQIGEIILCVFNKDGRLLSNLPISGGYGDDLTFTSKITDKKVIEIETIKYNKDQEHKYRDVYLIDNKGNIKCTGR